MSRTGSPSFFGFLLNGIAMKFDAESWMLERGRLGGLDCIVISPRAGTPKSLVVLCHGFGAPGSDLVNLAEELVPILAGESRRKLRRLRFYSRKAFWICPRTSGSKGRGLGGVSTWRGWRS